MKMTKDEAKEFASRWLPAWTGNDPERLASYYADDCFYLDPGIPNGLNGKKELIEYFSKLLGQNPNWIWTQIEPIPMEGGFLNKWLAKIPVGEKIVECIGVCFVQFDSQTKIKRNEVYFDRSDLISGIMKYKKHINVLQWIGRQRALVSVHPSMANLSDTRVARKILSSEYQPYACGKIFRAP